MWAIPPVWFFLVTVPLILGLAALLYRERIDALREDSEWRARQQRLHGLNRPVFPPTRARMITGAASAVAYVDSSAYSWVPGAKWPVSSPDAVQFYG